MKIFAKYVSFGLIGVFADYIVFYALIKLGEDYQISNFLGYFSGTALSFFLNRNYNFSVKDKVFIRLTYFYLTALVGYLLSVILLHVSVELFLLSPEISKILTLPFVAIVQFFLNKKISFG